MQRRLTVERMTMIGRPYHRKVADSIQPSAGLCQIVGQRLGTSIAMWIVLHNHCRTHLPLSRGAPMASNPTPTDLVLSPRLWSRAPGSGTA